MLQRLVSDTIVKVVVGVVIGCDLVLRNVRWLFLVLLQNSFIKQGKQCKTKPSKMPVFRPDALAHFRVLGTTHVYGVHHSLNFNIAYTQFSSVYLDNPGSDLSACSTLSVAAQQAGNSNTMQYWN